VAGDFLELRGADGFLRLSKALKQAGQVELRKKLHKGMRDAVKAYKPKAEEALGAVLPSGLQGRAKVRQTIRVRTGGDPGVSVVVPYGKRSRSGLGASNARMLNNQGMIRHPMFADSDLERKQWWWLNQDIGDGTGWFDDVWRASSPKVRRELELQIQAVLDGIAREVGR
jgi:hypothetical protein